MALRFDATADVLSRTSDMLSFNSNYTLMYWVYLVSDINAAGVLSALTNSAGSSIDGILIDSDGTTLVNYVDVPGVASGTLPTGTWTHLTQRRRSTTAHDLMTNGVTTTTRTTSVSGSRTQNAMYLGSFGGVGNRCDVRIGCIKAWDTDLSDAEVLNEMNSLRPIRTANLYGWWPVIGSTTGTSDDDFSGNGRHWTPGGTLTLEDGPGVAWGAQPIIFPAAPLSTIDGTFAVTGGADTMSATGTTTVVGSLARTTGNDTLSATGTTTVVGTLAVTSGNDTMNASGSVGSPVEGTFAVTSGNDTMSASGTTTIIGSLALTAAADTLSANGTTTIVGTLAVTVPNDTLSASGTTTIVGSLTITAGNDTMNASGSVGDAVSGTFSVTGANDTMSASGTTTLVGTFTVSGAGDTLSASGTTTVLGTMAVTLGNDVMSASGTSGSAAAISSYLALTNVGR